MLSKCCSCFQKLRWKLKGPTLPKWHTHLRTYCSARAQKQPWCQMFLDNIDLITDQTLPKQIEYSVKNTNIASQIVGIITKHFEQETNLFKFCIDLFGAYLKLKYSQLINPSKNSLIRIANQYQQFIQLIIDLFVLYYNLEDRQIVGEQVFYKATLPFLASQFTFSNQDILSTVLKTAKSSMKSHIDKLQYQIQKYMHHTINQFSVRQQFQLNQRSLGGQKLSGGKSEERLYLGTINIIHQIVRVHSPAQKMKLAEGIKKQISSSIQQFYNKHGFKEKKIELNNQDLNSLLCYIIVQANQPAFFAHLQIIQLFCKELTKKQNILELLLTACEDIENGSFTKREASTFISEMASMKRKNSDSLNFFDEVSNSHLDL